MSYLKYQNDEKFNIARGIVRNASARNIFGYQTAVTTDFIPAWEFTTSYTYPTANTVMTVSAAEASDNGKNIIIQGLDSNYEEITDTVTLTGGGDTTTNVPFFRINDVILVTGGTNDGLVTIQNAGKTIKYAGIRAEDGRNQASIYTVPAGKEFYLYRLDAFSADSTSGKPGIFKNVTITSTGQTYNVARTTFFNNMNIQRRLPFKYSEKSDIQLQLQTQSGTHEMNVFGEGILLDLDGTGLRT